MIATMLFAFATVAGVDPVAGSSMYTPAIGENAVLHQFNPGLGTTSPLVHVWTNTTALSKFVEGMQSEAFQNDLAKVLGNLKEFGILHNRHRDALLKEPTKRGEILTLPDMTPVRVRVLAQFNKPTKELQQDFSTNLFMPDYFLVEVLDGPMKERFFWASRFVVRVPGSKIPKLDEFNFAADPPEDKPVATPSTSPASIPSPLAPKLLVESSSWNRLADFVQVHCRVRNVSNQAIESLTATVVYEDAAGNLVYSGSMIIGDLNPGDSKTVMSMDQHNSRMNHYKFEFEGRDDTGKRHGIDSTTAGAKVPVRRR